MTPAVLQPLFEQWRKEGKSFYVSSENYNKFKPLVESAGGGGLLALDTLALIC